MAEVPGVTCQVYYRNAPFFLSLVALVVFGLAGGGAALQLATLERSALVQAWGKRNRGIGSHNDMAPGLGNPPRKVNGVDHVVSVDILLPHRLCDGRRHEKREFLSGALFRWQSDYHVVDGKLVVLVPREEDVPCNEVLFRVRDPLPTKALNDSGRIFFIRLARCDWEHFDLFLVSGKAGAGSLRDDS
jgi:hypothetical protein